MVGGVASPQPADSRTMCSPCLLVESVPGRMRATPTPARAKAASTATDLPRSEVLVPWAIYATARATTMTPMLTKNTSQPNPRQCRRVVGSIDSIQSELENDHEQYEHCDSERYPLPMRARNSAPSQVHPPPMVRAVVAQVVLVCAVTTPGPSAHRTMSQTMNATNVRVAMSITAEAQGLLSRT